MSHNLSGRMYYYLNVGMLLLGSLVGLVSPSLAQEIPGPGLAVAAQFRLHLSPLLPPHRQVLHAALFLAPHLPL